MPNDELAEAGNGTGEIRAWVALAAAMGGAPGKVLSYEPVYEWINGMGVVLYDGDQAGYVRLSRAWAAAGTASGGPAPPPLPGRRGSVAPPSTWSASAGRA